MKRNLIVTILFFLLLILAPVLSNAQQAITAGTTATSTAWLPPLILPEQSELTRTPGWWGEIPAAIQLPTLTPSEQK